MIQQNSDYFWKRGIFDNQICQLLDYYHQYEMMIKLVTKTNKNNLKNMVIKYGYMKYNNKWNKIEYVFILFKHW